MRKVITLRLWIDDDWSKGSSGDYMDDDKILEDICAELEYCNHNYEIIKFETMEIANEKATKNAAGDLLRVGA